MDSKEKKEITEEMRNRTHRIWEERRRVYKKRILKNLPIFKSQIEF